MVFSPQPLDSSRNVQIAQHALEVPTAVLEKRYCNCLPYAAHVLQCSTSGCRRLICAALTNVGCKPGEVAEVPLVIRGSWSPLGSLIGNAWRSIRAVGLGSPLF